MADSTGILQPYPVLFDKSGQPLDAGYVYVGQYGLNPETSQINVYWDADLTQPAPQPIRTINGYYSRNGTPAKIFINGAACSISVRDKSKSLVFNDLYSSGQVVANGLPASLVMYGSITQKDFNDGVGSIAELSSIASPFDGMRVYVVDRGNYIYDSVSAEWLQQDYEFINIKSVYGGIDDFGVALELAFNKAMSLDCRRIVIPEGVYSAKTTANITLTSNFTLEFSAATTVNADNRVDIIDVTQSNYTLNIVGNGASVYPNWSTGVSSVSVLKLNSQTLGKSAFISDFNIYEKDGEKFDIGINAVGLNYSTIEDCVIQAVSPIVNASALSGTTHAMGSEVVRCKLFGDTAVTLVNNGDLGCEGWKFVGGEYLCKTGIEVIDNLNSSAYYPPLLIVDAVHINAERFFSLSGISRVKISGCDLQAQVANPNPFNGLIEFDGVQAFDIDETTAISQADTTGTAPNDSLPVFFLRNSAKSKTSAFIEFGIKNYWLVQNAPLIEFDTSVNLVGRVNFGKINTNAFPSSIVSTTNSNKVSVSIDTFLVNSQVSSGFSISTDAAFNSGTGVLTLGKSPSFGKQYQIPTSIVPDNSTINQIKVTEEIGDVFEITLDASNVTFNHSANMYTPIGVQNKTLYGCVLRVLSYNSDLCRILSISPHASILPAPVPASTGDFGINGQKVYSGGFIYEYIYGAGWVRYSASTF